MTPSLFGVGNDPLAALSQDQSGQRAQLAQYAIIRAATLMKGKRNDEAIREFKKALAFDPQNTTAKTNIGKIYLSQGNTREAIKTFTDLVRSTPNSVDAHVNLANAYLQDKQYAQSEKEFKAAARLDPQNPLADYTLGLQYMQTGRLAEAKEQFLKVKKVAPKDGNVYYSLGALYNKQGNYEEAVANLEKALTLKKSFPAANYELGSAYAALGRKDDAQRQLSILQSSDYGLYYDLKSRIDKPRILAMDTKNSGGFAEILGPGTPLWTLDPSLITPNSGKIFSVSFVFSSDMDLASVTNTQNWSITRANGGSAGYYNNTMPLSSKDVALPSTPESVFYNPVTKEATIKFRLNQNAAGNAVIDPSHIVFSFKGKDAAGRDMDPTSNNIDGFSSLPF